MRLFYSFLLLLFCSFTASAQQLFIDYHLYKQVSKEEFRQTLKEKHVPKALVPARYTVDIYDVTYYTHWHDGSLIKATGLVYVPQVDSGSSIPELVYHHGTRVSPGRDRKPGGEEYICLGMAADGYMVLQPDYIGLGRGEKFHLYQMAKPAGQTTADMLLAMSSFDSIMHIRLNGQLFLTGYSEGGYASLAAHKYLQENYPDRFPVTASSPMSGAYDMAGAQSVVMFRPYPNPHYLPFLLRGYNEVYHLIPRDINTIYKTPYDSLIPAYFDGHHGIHQIDAMLPSTPKDMILDTFVNIYLHDTTFRLKQCLAANGLCEWKPMAPVQLCYCDSDDQVLAGNSIAAYDGMKRAGAEHVTLKRAGKKFKHVPCALYATLYTKMYFDSFRKGSKYGRKGPAGKRFLLSLAKAVSKEKTK